jgi:hypothetical protein
MRTFKEKIYGLLNIREYVEYESETLHKRLDVLEKTIVSVALGFNGDLKKIPDTVLAGIKRLVKEHEDSLASMKKSKKKLNRRG